MVASAQGEDRSNHNPVAGWAGLSFGFVKATEGLTYTDPTFAKNWANLKAAGLPRGAYHFFHPEMDPVKQAQKFVAFVKAAGLADGDMLVCDTETPAGNVDIATKAFMDQVKVLAGGHHPLLVYTNHNVGQNLKQTAAAYPELWFAYPSSTAPAASLYAPWKAWRFWQWGIQGGTDKDAYNGTQADMQAWLKTFQTVPLVVIHWRTLGFWSLARQAQKHHMTPEGMIELAAKQHYKYGPAMQRYIRHGNWNARLPRLTMLFAYKR